MPAGGMPYLRAASTLLVAAKPARYDARAMRRAASVPCVRRDAKSAIARPLCGLHTPRRFGGQQALVLNLVDYDGFYQLDCDDWARDFHNRFIGEKQGAFRHRSHVSGEPKISQIFEEIVGEYAGRAQVIDAGFVERQSFQAIQRIVNTGRDHIPSVGRVIAHVEAERRFAGHSFRKVGLPHGEFVKVGEKAAVTGGHWKVGRLVLD